MWSWALPLAGPMPYMFMSLVGLDGTSISFFFFFFESERVSLSLSSSATLMFQVDLVYRYPGNVGLLYALVCSSFVSLTW